MIEKISNVLDREEKLLKNLLVLLEVQHRAVVKNDIESMETVVEKLISEGTEIEKSENERKMIMGDISLKDISKNNENIDYKLREIKKILSEINVQKRTNTLLLKQGINFNNKVMKILKQDSGHSVYNNTGKINK